MSEKSRCEAIKADGSRCKNDAMAGKEWCYSHSPEGIERRKEWGAVGGKTQREDTEVLRVEAIRRKLRSVTESIISGAMDAERGRVAVASLQAELRGCKVKDEIVKSTVMKERISRLEKIAAAKEQK